MMSKLQQPPADGRIWKQVPAYEYLFASEDGQIWSGKAGVLKAQRSVGKRRNYMAISVYEGSRKDKGRQLKVHRLVAMAFHGLAPTEKHTVDHINRDPLDNRQQNLRWACPVVQAVNRDDSLTIKERSNLLARHIELLAMHREFSKSFFDSEISILEKAMGVLAKTAEQ